MQRSCSTKARIGSSAALSAIAEVLPWREVAVCRELTKLHEEVARGTAAELCERFAARAKEPGGVRGEIALVIDAPGEAEAAAGAEIATASATARAAELVAEGLRTKEVAKRLAAEFGIPRNDAYNLAHARPLANPRVILSERSDVGSESHGPARSRPEPRLGGEAASARSRAVAPSRTKGARGDGAQGRRGEASAPMCASAVMLDVDGLEV